MKLPYKEGDIFCVPLRGGGFAFGVVARSPKNGKILLGYFFCDEPGLCLVPKDVPALEGQNAVKVVRFGDLSLVNGDWPVVGRINDWDRRKWPMPKFIQRDELAKRAWLISYSDEDPSRIVSRHPCSIEENSYERDSLLGAGFVELLLTKACSEKENRQC